jgi:hypothetical protein
MSVGLLFATLDCSEHAPATLPDAATSDSSSDAAASALDVAEAVPGGGRIGDPCQSDSDCGEGVQPVCFVQAVAGFSPAKTPGGYCSAPCGKTQSDCGTGSALCMWFGFATPYCFRPCSTPLDCRAGYSCFSWMTPICFPSQPFIDCDPRAGDGTCTTADGLPGGCYRLAVGDGNAGRCGARCDIGAGHCADDPNGAALRCRPMNGTLDADGGATGDPWQGSVCDVLAGTPLTAGACVYGWSKPPRNYATQCADGFDCASQFDPFGDEDCVPLCYLDGGAPAGDAGASQCAAGSTCKDAYRLGASTNPSTRVGLCAP